MQPSRILLLGLTAANKVAGRAAELLGRTIEKLLVLADDPEHFDVAKAAIVQLVTPLLGAPVLDKLGATKNGVELRTVCERLSIPNFVQFGVDSGTVTNELWNTAVPSELQVLLPVSDIVTMLVGDTSGWWKERNNAGPLAEIASGLLVDTPSLGGDFVAALDLEGCFTGLAGDPELVGRFAVFVAGLRAGVRGSDAFDAKLLAVFTVAELVRYAATDAVWSFCKDGLRLAARAADSQSERSTPAATEPTPSASTFCKSCGYRVQGTPPELCPSCSSAFMVNAPTATA